MKNDSVIGGAVVTVRSHDFNISRFGFGIINVCLCGFGSSASIAVTQFTGAYGMREYIVYLGAVGVEESMSQ